MRLVFAFASIAWPFLDAAEDASAWVPGDSAWTSDLLLAGSKERKGKAETSAHLRKEDETIANLDPVEQQMPSSSFTSL
ncbi:hypothetical protein F5880DRAFT_1607840 [Lentinula raphanica]|nr:hypothetical protein F5880DRAFT_1607840 [Lentinula raphanica]